MDDFYYFYMQSPEWEEKRKEALLRAGYKCCLCSSRGPLRIHHNTYERIGEELPADLACLCERCHHLYHKFIDKRTGDKRSRSETEKKIEKRAKGRRRRRNKALMKWDRELTEWEALRMQRGITN